MAIVFEEQELYGFGFNEAYGVYMLNSNHCSYTLEKGMQYLVTWDGIVYECVAQDMSAMQEGALALGNMTSFGGTGNDEPFIIGWSELGETYMSFEDAISHTLAIEKIEEAEEKAGADIVLYDRTGAAVKYENVETITTDTPDAEQGATFTYGVAVENAEYEPDFANGNQKVTLEKGQLLKEFTVVKPENLLPEYIKKNVEVAGVIGEFAGDEMEKTVELAMTDGNQVIEADEDTVLTKVTVIKPETLVPENIAKGVDIGGVVGTMNIGPITNTLEGVYVVTVIDFDGSIIKTQELSSGEKFILPDAPEHDRLVFDGWSSPVEITNNTITVDNFDLTIGAIYHTASGATELDIELTPDIGLSLSFRGAAYLVNYTSIDWGDGTVNTSLSHTYESYGNYTIKIYGATVLSGGSSSYNIFGSATANQRYCVRKAFIANTVTNIAIGAFKGFYNLQCVTIPNSVTSIGDYAFGSIYTETTIIIPNSVTTLGIAFNYCVGLNTIILPYSITALKGSTFYQASLVKNDLVIPKGITVLNAGAFTNCTAVKKVIVLGDITSISGNAFQNFHSCEEYDFTRCTRVPSFNNTPIGKCGIQKIKVPASLYDAWVASWSTYANYIVAV